MRTRTALVISLGALALLAIAPAARAATATIGSGLNLPMSIPGQVCTNNCLAVQQAQVGGQLPLPLLSPVNGVLTSWKVRTGDPDALYTLRLLTPGAGSSYIATKSVQAPAPVPPGTVDSIITYTAPSVPINQGQAIGVLQTGNPEGLPQNTTNGVNANVMAFNLNGNFNDGLGATFMPDVQHELLLQATIQFCKVPAITGLKKGPAKQALAAADCGSKVKKKPARKRKNRGKVLKQKKAAGTTAAPGTVVPILVGSKPPA
jgi:hypothetical protein